MFPPGTTFWLVLVDAFAEVDGCDQLLRPDGSIVEGSAAGKLRASAAADGVRITEAEFRALAPPSISEQLEAMAAQAKHDPIYHQALRDAAALLAPRAERVCRDIMEHAPDAEDRRQAARLLAEFAARKQNRDGQ